MTNLDNVFFKVLISSWSLTTSWGWPLNCWFFKSSSFKMQNSWLSIQFDSSHILTFLSFKQTHFLFLWIHPYLTLLILQISMPFYVLISPLLDSHFTLFSCHLVIQLGPKLIINNINSPFLFYALHPFVFILFHFFIPFLVKGVMRYQLEQYFTLLFAKVQGNLPVTGFCF